MTSLINNKNKMIEYAYFNENNKYIYINNENIIIVYDIVNNNIKFKLDGGVKLNYFYMIEKKNIIMYITKNNPNSLIFYDYQNKKKINKVEFDLSNIYNIKIDNNYIYVVLNDKIELFTYNDNFCIIKHNNSIKTYNNSRGLFSIYKNIYIYPCKKTNELLFAPTFDNTQKIISSKVNANDIDNLIVISNKYKYMSMPNMDGTKIFVFDLLKNKMITELKRGYKSSKITSICFSVDDKLLACSSQTGTVHIYNLDVNDYLYKYIGISFNTIFYKNSDLQFKKEKHCSYLKFIKSKVKDNYILYILYDNMKLYIYNFNIKDILLYNNKNKIYQYIDLNNAKKKIF